MDIYITRNGQQLGPYSVHEANRNLSTGQVDPADLAWHAGRSEWVPLSTVPGIMASPPPHPQALPPAPTGGQVKQGDLGSPPPSDLPPVVKWTGITILSILYIAAAVLLIAALIPLLPVAIAGVPITTILIFISWKALANIGKSKK